MNITQKEYRLLLEELAYLRKRVEFLEEENAKLRAENQRLTQENIELKDRLGLNSSNSSLPSSRDLYTIKKMIKQPSDKKPGGQKGHVGVTRKKMTPHETVVIKPEKTFCQCGGVIALEKTPQIIQKIDMLPIQYHVVEYQLYKGRCSCCRKRYRVSLPEGVTPDLLGPQLKTIVASLTAMFKSSKREVQAILKSMFGVELSLGTISNTEERVSNYCQKDYDALVSKICQSEKLHGDETGHKNKGIRHWLWLFTNPKATVLVFRRSRGMKVLKEILPEFKGTVISDRYAVYNHFNQTQRQICWAHLLRDFERIAHSAHMAVSIYGKYLKSLGREVFGLYNALKNQAIDHITFLRRISKLRKRLLYYLRQLLRIKDVDHVHNVVKLLIKAEPMMWKFLDDPLEIPLTNNLAERQIRHFVVYRKKSFFTWSDRGDRFLERLMSLHLTWKQNGLNPFDQLSSILSA